MQLSSDDVAAIVQEVWSSMLGLEFEPVQLEHPPEGDAVAGSVGVNGAADCLIALELDVQAARTVASTMFGLDPDATGQDDIADTVGELTNMVGGNIKSLLPEPSTLSLPVVAHGRIPTIKVVGAQVLLNQLFLMGSDSVRVSVWNRTQH